jgi:hypothetical protein
MHIWKRWLLIGAGIGAVGVIAFGLAAGAMRWHQSRPKAWDTQAFEVVYDGIDTVQNYKVGQSDERDWFRFRYLVKNKTGQDYELIEGSAKIMAKLQDSGSLLHDPQLTSSATLKYPLFIPTGQSVSLEIHVPAYGFNVAPPTDRKSAEYSEYRRKLLAFLEDEMGNLGGFVLFDNIHRYQITFPVGWIERLKKEVEAK